MQNKLAKAEDQRMKVTTLFATLSVVKNLNVGEWENGG
jgi:hypothetical protein